MPALDRIVFASSTIRVGSFRCTVDDPRFRDSGPIEANLVVFPRRAVWIRQEGSLPLVADARTSTIYNRGRLYERRAVSAEGDWSDWFAVAPEVAVALAAEVDCGSSADPERAFRPEAAPTDHALYLRQRRLFLALERKEMDTLEAEEAVVGLVEEVLRRGLGRSAIGSPGRGRARRDLVERAKADLAARLAEPAALAGLAGRVGASPSHLCRVFREETGVTLHEYRLDLRLRAALESFEAPAGQVSRLAAELGFSSHSHFTAALRRRHGMTPTRYRVLLAGRYSGRGRTFPTPAPRATSS